MWVKRSCCPEVKYGSVIVGKFGNLGVVRLWGLGKLGWLVGCGLWDSMGVCVKREQKEEGNLGKKES